MKTFYLNFVEEFVLNPDYEGYRAGRVEIFQETPQESPYAIDEYRFFYPREKEKAFDIFRDKWDFKSLNEEELIKFKEFLQKEYYDTDNLYNN